MFRHPRTRNEMRSYDPETLAEYGIKVRGKRKPRNLPNTWDDNYRSDAVTKSWKDRRGTQYRAREITEGSVVSEAKPGCSFWEEYLTVMAGDD